MELTAAERDRILLDLDIKAARRFMPVNMSDEGILVGMHKSRINLPKLPRDKRQESLDWLRQHGFKNYGGGPLPDQLEDE
jgi:hypothetical protein